MTSLSPVARFRVMQADAADLRVIEFYFFVVHNKPKSFASSSEIQFSSAAARSKKFCPARRSSKTEFRRRREIRAEENLKRSRFGSSKRSTSPLTISPKCCFDLFRRHFAHQNRVKFVFQARSRRRLPCRLCRPNGRAPVLIIQFS